jgi:hypothetical protein
MGGAPASDDRAQLILVGALSLATVLVALALVMNSAIFAENLATREGQQKSGQVVTLEQEAQRGAGVAMQHLHHDAGSHATYADLEDGLETSINEWSDTKVRDSAREGKYVDIQYTGTYTKGTRIGQDGGGTFSPGDSGALDPTSTLSDLTSWVVAEDADEMRDFTMTVERDELEPVAEANVGVYLGNLEGTVSLTSPPFTAIYDVNGDGSVEHSFAIYQADDGDADSNDVKVTYRDAATGRTTTCEVDDAEPTFEVDISGGRVEGGDGCAQVFDFRSGITDPVRLHYAQPTAIEGDYEFITKDTNAEFENEYDSGILGLLGLGTFDDVFDDHTDGHSASYSPSDPYVEPAIYSAEMGLSYRSSEASYETTVTVAPNEP